MNAFTPIGFENKYIPFNKYEPFYHGFNKDYHLSFAICEMLSNKIGNGLQSRIISGGRAEFRFDTFVTLQFKNSSDLC